MLKPLVVLLWALVMFCQHSWATGENDNPGSHNNPDLRAISERMTRAAVIRGEFAQEKYFSIMTRPLLSQGQFTLLREKGIWWHNTQPVTGDLVITDSGLLQRSASGETQRVSSEKHPALKTMTDIIRQLVAGDWNQLSQHFDIRAVLAEKEWTATLIPKKTSPLHAFARTIELRGQADVRAIKIDETNGDKTAIAFSQIRYDSQLQPSETDAFAW